MTDSSDQPDPTDHTVTVSFTAEEYDRLQSATDDPTALVREATRDRLDLEESIAFTRDGGFRSAMGTEGMTANDVPRPPIGELVGFDVRAVGEGEALVTMEGGPEHANPAGTMHGGVFCDLGDAAMGVAFASTLEEEESFTTLELDCRYLRPVWDDTLEARGEVVYRGGTVGLVEARVTNAEGKLVARLASTVMVLRGEQASGR